MPKCRCPPSVQVGGGVTSIGSYAFSDCTVLYDIILPASVTSIGTNAFNGCKNLAIVWCEEKVIPSGWSNSWLGNSKKDVTVYLGDDWYYNGSSPTLKINNEN